MRLAKVMVSDLIADATNAGLDSIATASVLYLWETTSEKRGFEGNVELARIRFDLPVQEFAVDFSKRTNARRANPLNLRGISHRHPRTPLLLWNGRGSASIEQYRSGVRRGGIVG